MKKLWIAIIFAAVLTGCSNMTGESEVNAAAGSTTDIIVTKVPLLSAPAEYTSATEDTGDDMSGSTEETAAVTASLSSSPLTLEEAMSVFTDTHPDIPIQAAKQEGDVFYIEGHNDNKIYKMKIGVADGAVYLDKIITGGRH